MVSRKSRIKRNLDSFWRRGSFKPREKSKSDMVAENKGESDKIFSGVRSGPESGRIGICSRRLQRARKRSSIEAKTLEHRRV